MYVANMRLLAGVFGLVLAFGAVARGETWNIDDSHSQANLKIKHLMISTVHGKITGIKGTVDYDGKDVTKASVMATLDPATIDTGNAKRDEHLRSADFLDVAKFKTMTFKSTGIEKAGDGFKLKGAFTMHGVTKSVTLNADAISPEIKDPWGNFRHGISASTKISRKDFGLAWNKALESGGVVVGDELDITIEMEIMKAGAAKASK